MKRILLLGSGNVVPPLLRYLSPHHKITIASPDVPTISKLATKFPNSNPRILNVDDDLSLISHHDLVVSLVPPKYHPKIAKECLSHGVDMITSSYISPEMKALDKEAREKGILLLNEMGLDPGIDHMTVMKIKNDIESRGGRITSFKSFCGALPDPSISNNPLGYKFSWSPSGVLNASQNSATWLEKGQIKTIPGSHLMANSRPVNLLPAFNFHMIPNRDSLSYVDTYEMKDHPLKDFIRGTLRWPGFCDMMLGFQILGLLSDQVVSPVEVTSTWRDLIGEKIPQRLLAGLSQFDPVQEKYQLVMSIVKDLEILDMLSYKKITVPHNTTIRELLSQHLSKRLAYKEGEHDLVFMFHSFKYLIGGVEHCHKSYLSLYGNDSESAISQTVGLPMGIASEMILNKEISLTGVQGPTNREIWDPVLKKLEKEGIKFRELL